MRFGGQHARSTEPSMHTTRVAKCITKYARLYMNRCVTRVLKKTSAYEAPAAKRITRTHVRGCHIARK